jgi:hypothetical protein
MSHEKPHNPVVIRFLLDLQAEEASYVDLEFTNLKQAKRAITDVFSGNGALVMLTTMHEIPVLIRTAHVSAAFPIEYDGDGEEDEED